MIVLKGLARTPANLSSIYRYSRCYATAASDSSSSSSSSIPQNDDSSKYKTATKAKTTTRTYKRKITMPTVPSGLSSLDDLPLNSASTLTKKTYLLKSNSLKDSANSSIPDFPPDSPTNNNIPEFPDSSVADESNINSIPFSSNSANSNTTSASTYTNNSFLSSPSSSSSTSNNFDTTFEGIGQKKFDDKTCEALLKELDPIDIEIKPDGILYLPEIKYRRILNRAFGPGNWGLVPRDSLTITDKYVSREFGLICENRLVSIARGEQIFFNQDGIPTAIEGCKSNALMRCCKDLGIASELWDPRFIRNFKKQYCEEKFAEHVVTKKKKKLWRRKDTDFTYPYKQT
ncbi:mitochondrial genome maintenance protein MGM101 [Ascoidea rubescens DSM 1968]|uniref:Mitochondrial genome maintenance protein MGM101 n=1 Tax=Ascoidea rubescens DSM 1968 TaxID=1344418 RepID=A0A1D2VHN0_9ASCO|nr:Mgm101p-domain-containing protein [Ascoidea rubescens DSM 1968]ODV61099.1 Mgm101p-domain-containing protein [Ascoidea rubescens DSM 1968]